MTLQAGAALRGAPPPGRRSPPLGACAGRPRRSPPVAGRALVSGPLRPATAGAVPLPASTARRRPRRLARFVAGAGGRAAVGEGQRLAGQFLDLAQKRPLAVVAERNGAAGLACARRAADAVDIGLRNLRQLVVHHVADAVDVDAARGDVGRDQDAGCAALEVVERPNALVLALVAVDRLRPDAGGVEVLRDAVGAALGAGEDDARASRRRRASVRPARRAWRRCRPGTRAGRPDRRWRRPA